MANAPDPGAIQQVFHTISKQLGELRQEVADHDRKLSDLDKEAIDPGDIKSIRISIQQLEKRVNDLEKKVKK